MLSVIVQFRSVPRAARSGAEPLAITLSALVPGVIDGLIRQAVVITSVSRHDDHIIAEAMGATIVTGPMPEAMHAARAAIRSPWVLLLGAGDVPDHGWLGAVERHILDRGMVGGRQRSHLGTDTIPQDLSARDVAWMPPYRMRHRLAERLMLARETGEWPGLLMPTQVMIPPRWPRSLPCRRRILE